MRDSVFDPWELLVDLRNRWPVVAASCAVALVVTLAVSVIRPKRYTATAEILIQAPGGNDPRASTAISPVYLESLKAYESLASSDTLFLRALNHVHAPEIGSGRSIESIKKSILQVSKPANVAVLTISATMVDPQKAQALAQYIAEQTVEQSRSIDSQSEIEMTRELRSQLDAAVDRLTKTRHAQDTIKGSEPVDSLENQVRNNGDLKLNIDKDLSQIRTDLSGYLAEQQLLPVAAGGDAENLRRLIASAQARIATLESQRKDLISLIGQQGAQVQEWKNRKEALQADQKSAQIAFESSDRRLNEMVASSQFRGERLRVIEPGIVPQEPSSPNIPLNLLAAFVLSLAGSVIYLAMTFSYRQAKPARAKTLPESTLSFRR
jgi:capsular polysaccharide biosynthesis protein